MVKSGKKRGSESEVERGTRTCPEVAPAVLNGSFKLHHITKESNVPITKAMLIICKLIFHAHLL